MARILIYGDSNSHGTAPLVVREHLVRYPVGQAWPEVMAAALGAGHCVITEALPGRTTIHDDPEMGAFRNGLQTLPAILLSHEPLDLVVLMLGTNDLKHCFGVPVSEIAGGIDALLDEIRARLPDVALLLICPAPIRETGVTAEVFAGGAARQEGIEAAYRAVAQRKGAHFLAAGDHVAVSPVDGIHWDLPAHAAFGEVMAAEIRALFPVPTPPSPVGARPAPDPDRGEAPITLHRAVPLDWVDYNGHMNEARYLTAFSDACDQMLLWAGLGAEAVAAGHSIFTVETHIRHLGEVAIGEAITVRTRVLEGGGKKLHIWHDLSTDAGLCATGEQLLLHMDLNARKSAPPPPDVADWLTRAACAQAPLPRPVGLGRFVGQRP